MPRQRQHTPLRVLLNNHLMGRLLKESRGTITCRYDESWLSRDNAIPVSLSLPLREDAFKGKPGAAVFENLLPDSDVLRRRIAEKVGAKGTDAYSLLSQIGRDCVGALQFVPEGDDAVYETSVVKGEVLSEYDTEKLLNNLARAPLARDRNEQSRISVAGAPDAP